jgi:dTDP-4-dehydrorhamnose reductase
VTVPRTLVIGAGGFLGRMFLENFGREHGVARGTTRRELDLADPDPSTLARRVEGCTHALLLAAIPQIDRCAQDPAGTRRVNVDGTMRVAEHLLSLGVTPVFFSSDYVFKGDTGGYTDDAPLDPTTEYGRQKVEVEQRLRELGPERSLIVRLSKVYDMMKGDGTLLDAIAATLVRGGVVRAASDQRFCPTMAGDVLRAVRKLLSSDARGTINVCDDTQACSRLDVARAVERQLRAYGPVKGTIEETTLAGLGMSDRPRDTTMRCVRLRALGFAAFVCPLVDAADFVASKWAAS